MKQYLVLFFLWSLTTNAQNLDYLKSLYHLSKEKAIEISKDFAGQDYRIYKQKELNSTYYLKLVPKKVSDETIRENGLDPSNIVELFFIKLDDGSYKLTSANANEILFIAFWKKYFRSDTDIATLESDIKKQRIFDAENNIDFKAYKNENWKIINGK